MRPIERASFLELNCERGAPEQYMQQVVLGALELNDEFQLDSVVDGVKK